MCAFFIPVSSKFVGRGTGGVSGVGGEGEASGCCALPVTVTARFARGHPRQRDVGSTPQRPTRAQETQIWEQERWLRVAEWLLRTQDGQDRDHQRDGLLGLEESTDGEFRSLSYSCE